MPKPSPPSENGVQIEGEGIPLPPDQAPGASPLNLVLIISGVSLLTSLTSLIGFISTIILDWRKEKRETRSSELEIQKKELELEKLRMELAKSEERRKNESA